MKKILFPKFIAVVCLLLCTTISNSLAQAPDGFHCVGQPVGQLLSFDYPASEYFPAETVVFGIGAAPIPSFGPRGSVNYKIRPESFYSQIENMHLITDSLVQTMSGMTEILWGGDPDFPVQAYYGTTIRHNGPTEVESSVYVAADLDGAVTILKTSQVSLTGKYSVFATIGDNIYGLRSGGGSYGHGVFFSINEAGSNYTELYHFHSEAERPDKLMLRYEFNNDGTPDTSQPQEFWGISYAGGSHGKGALMVLAIDGSSVWTRLDFTGQGGADNSWGPTDGEGPVAILQDIDTDGYVITRSGGAHNKGAIFMIGMDGNHKVHDFTSQYGTPSGSAAVDKTSKKVFGISGDTEGNDGYIYSFSLLSDYNFNEHLVDFNNNEYKDPISLAPVRGNFFYVTVAEGATPGQGSLIYINQDGSDLTHSGEFENCFATVTNPPDNATNVPLQPTLRASRTSTRTTFQLSEEPDFSDELITLTLDQVHEGKLPHPLKPGTLYYARIDQDISFPGPVTKFTTATNNLVTYIKDPTSGEIDIPANPLIKLASITGATSYTVEVSEQSDFSSGTITKTSSTTDLRITGPLKYSTVYYARAKSNASAEYSYVTQFTIHGPEKNCFVSSPAHEAFPVAIDNLKLTANLVNGATTYTIQISTDHNFSSNNTITKVSAVPGQRTIAFPGLSPYTTYYNRVKTDLSPEWGPRRYFTTAPELTYVTLPANNKTNVSLNAFVVAKEVAGANIYTLELSTTPDFSANVTSYQNTGISFKPGFAYSTTYYTRVKTSYTSYGQVTSFTTQPPELYSFVSSPVNGATIVAYQGLKVTANEVLFSTTYTIELNTTADFTGTSIVKTSSVPRQRTMTFDLAPSTTYYNRTRTDISGWGPTRSFTTAAGVSAPPVFQEHVAGITASPNPFNTTFTVGASPEVSSRTIVSLIDATGRVLHKQELMSGQDLELGEELASGLYILKLEQGTTMQIHRMIKNR